MLTVLACAGSSDVIFPAAATVIRSVRLIDPHPAPVITPSDAVRARSLLRREDPAADFKTIGPTTDYLTANVCNLLQGNLEDR